MELWHPRAIKVVPSQRPGGTYDSSYPWRQVAHTTEGGPGYSPTAANYYGHQNWPTATIARLAGVAHICQHFPISKSSYAVQNDPGGVETNRAKVVQFEIGWWAARIGELPPDLAACVRDWVTWVAQQTGSPLSAYSGSRMSGSVWRSFSGICGHRHVPENDHTDPGDLDWGKLLGQVAPSPAPVPGPASEDDVVDESLIPSWATMTPANYTFYGKPWGGRMPFFRLLCDDITEPFEAKVIAYPGVPLMSGLDQFPGWRYGDIFGIPTLFISGLVGKPCDLDESSNGDIYVLAADGGSFRVAKKP